jgi:predicted  nucleic acid-binding Zn-ribbon protein
MEQRAEAHRSDLVRCLDCGTIYSRPPTDDRAGPCPNCGYVGWIALDAPAASDETDS